jgi:hypothetical protein
MRRLVDAARLPLTKVRRASMSGSSRQSGSGRPGGIELCELASGKHIPAGTAELPPRPEWRPAAALESASRPHGHPSVDSANDPDSA